MQRRDIVLSVVAAGSGRPDLGRTSLQKATFFTGIMLHRDLGHSAYYYGPYSAAVEADTEALVASALVDEASRNLGVNKRGYPITQYQYTLTESGAERVAQLRSKYPSEVEAIEGLVGRLLDVVGSLDQNTLAAAAKTLYIAIEQGKPVTPDDIAKLAQDYGWQLTARRVADVAAMLQDLRFVRVGPS